MKTLLIIIRNIIFATGFLIILANQIVHAQTASPSFKIRDYSLTATNKSCVLKFTSENQVQNILVMVLDKKGNILFLDNKYRFRGNYQRTIELGDQQAGDYTLNITSDDEKISRTIHLE